MSGEDHNPDGFVRATPEQARIIADAVRRSGKLAYEAVIAEPGENLTRLAGRAFGVATFKAMATLLHLNRLERDAHIQPGDILITSSPRGRAIRQPGDPFWDQYHLEGTPWD